MERVKSGKIKDDDILLMLSINGAISKQTIRLLDLYLGYLQFTAQ